MSTGSYWSKTLAWITAHRTASTIAAIVLLSGAWYIYSQNTSTKGETRYILGTVSSSTIVASVSGSGQVSPSSQVDIKPKASGEITSVLVSQGDSVRAGQVLGYIDATDAQKQVRDAQANLESAQISLEKLKKPPTALSLTQAQNALTQAQDSLSKLYNDSQTDITNTFLDLPDIIVGLKGILTDSNSNSGSQWNMDYYLNSIENDEPKARAYRDAAYADYTAAKKAYDASFAEYQLLGNSPENASIEKSHTDTYTATNLALRAAKSASAFIQLYKDTMTAHNRTPSSVASTAITSLSTYTTTLNDHASGLLSDSDSLKTAKQSIVEKQQSLDETNSGADALDIQSAQLNVTKAKNAVTDAQNTLADYAIRAPFAGTIAKVDMKKGDSASSGTAAATIITKDQIADLSLNEVDAAKVKAGQKATLTFDAIDGLTIAGTVASVDTLGTVTQGVVSYNVKINFTTQDERVKPGMTANANIIVQTAQDALTVPSSAVKTQNGQSYVLVFDPALTNIDTTQSVSSTVTPKSASVITGISDDTNIQIISGLSLGQQIVVRTVSGSPVTNTTSSNRNGFGGGAGPALRGL